MHPDIPHMEETTKPFTLTDILSAQIDAIQQTLLRQNRIYPNTLQDKLHRLFDYYLHFAPGESLAHAYARKWQQDPTYASRLAGALNTVVPSLFSDDETNPFAPYQDRLRSAQLLRWLQPFYDAESYPFDVIAVLGAGITREEEHIIPTPGGKRRAMAGVIAWNQGLAPTIVFLGGKTPKAVKQFGENVPSEAHAMMHYVTQWCINNEGLTATIPAWAMVGEHQSTTTQENMLLLQDMAAQYDWGRIAVLTEQHHMERALDATGELTKIAQVTPMYAEGRFGFLSPLLAVQMQREYIGTHGRVRQLMQGANRLVTKLDPSGNMKQRVKDHPILSQFYRGS